MKQWLRTALIGAVIFGAVALAQQGPAGFGGGHQMADLFKVFFTWDASNLTVAGTRGVISAAGSGSNGFACTTNGCRYDIGAGANDYLTSDGTTMTTPGAFDVSNGEGVSAPLFQGRGTSLLDVAGRVADTAGLIGVRISNRTTMTVGTDRYITGFSNDFGTTIRSRIDTQGNYNAMMGTSTGYHTGIGIANTNSTAVGNVGASGPDDLITYTLPASALTTTNRAVRITAWGTCANTADAKTFTLNFGSQVILTHACTVSVAGEQWKIESTVIRTGASAQDWTSTYYGSTGAAGVFEFDPELGTATQTETSTIVIKMQSTVSTSNNDIVQEGMIVEYL